MKMGSVIVEKEKKVLTMAEYIKREALIDAVESIDWYSVYKGKLTAGAPNTENALYKASSIYAAIDNVPAADVVEVVRCRDCKYGDYDSKIDDAMVCIRTNDGYWRHGDDFCSYGRK